MFIKKILIFCISALLLFSINVNAYSKSVIDITKMNIKELSEALNLKLKSTSWWRKL